MSNTARICVRIYMLVLAFVVGIVAGSVVTAGFLAFNQKRVDARDRQLAAHDPDVADHLATYLIKHTMEDARAARLRYYARTNRNITKIE